MENTVTAIVTARVISYSLKPLYSTFCLVLVEEVYGCEGCDLDAHGHPTCSKSMR